MKRILIHTVPAYSPFKREIYVDTFSVVFLFTTSFEQFYHPTGKSWDGRYNDREQPQGVYVYNITAGYANGTEEKYEGHVTLIR